MLERRCQVTDGSFCKKAAWWQPCLGSAPSGFVFEAHGLEQQAADFLLLAGVGLDAALGAAEAEAAFFPAQHLAQQIRRIPRLLIEGAGGELAVGELEER